MYTKRFGIAGWLGMWVSSLQAAVPIGQAVTYQGQLRSAGVPFSGVVAMDFRLFDAASSGMQIGMTISQNVTATNGLFSVLLNAAEEWGPLAFTGEERFLEITVNGVILAPRQALTAAPFAHTAVIALAVEGVDGHSLDTSDGQQADALFVDASGRVGIGTTSPQDSVHILGDSPGATSLRIEQSGANSAANLVLGTLDDGGSSGSLIFERNSTVSAVIHHEQNLSFRLDGADVMSLLPGGTVGIGPGPFSTDADLQVGIDPVTNVVFGGANVQIGSPSAAQLILGRPGGDFLRLLTGAFGNEVNAVGVNGLSLETGPDVGGLQPRLFIATAGNVGIGTTTPSANLDVAGSLRVDTTTLVVNPATDRVGIGTAAPTTTLDVAGAAAVSGALTVDGGTLQVDAVNNRVGVGTTAPLADLHVQGQASPGSIAVTPNTSNANSQISLAENTSNTFAMILRYDGTANQLHFLANNGGTEAPPVFSINRSSSPAIGIGTTTPLGALHVQEGSAGTITPASTASVVLERGNHNYLHMYAPDDRETGILFGGDTTDVRGGVVFNSGLPNSLSFRTGGNTTRMIIDENGHVGIGGNPSSVRRLRVLGDLSIDDEIALEGTPTRAVVLSAADFQPISNQTTLQHRVGSNGIPHLFIKAGNGAAGTYRAVAPVHLPNDAIFTGFTVSGNSGLAAGTSIIVRFVGRPRFDTSPDTSGFQLTHTVTTPPGFNFSQASANSSVLVSDQSIAFVELDFINASSVPFIDLPFVQSVAVRYLLTKMP